MSAAIIFILSVIALTSVLLTGYAVETHFALPFPSRLSCALYLLLVLELQQLVLELTCTCGCASQDVIARWSTVIETTEQLSRAIRVRVGETIARSNQNGNEQEVKRMKIIEAEVKNVLKVSCYTDLP